MQTSSAFGGFPRFTRWQSFSCLLPLYINYGTSDGSFPSDIIKTYTGSALFHYSAFPYILLGIITVGLAALLFSYLNSKSACSTMHAAPVKRKTLYVTHVVFGIFSLLLPILINSCILLVMRSNPHFMQVVNVHQIWAWTYSQLVYALIGFSIAVFVGMFTGNSVAHLIFTYIFVFLPFFIEMACTMIMRINLYGYVAEYSTLITSRFLYFGLDRITLLSSRFVVYCLCGCFPDRRHVCI